MIEAIFKIYAYLFGGKIFIKFNKFLYQLSLRGMGILNYQSDYLSGEKLWLNTYLRKLQSPVVIDVGANVGKYSEDVLSINKNSHIMAFEPHPKTYKNLIDNITVNNFEPYNFGVGEKEGVLELYDYNVNDGSAHASLYKDVIKDLHNSESISHQVDIVKLDTFLKDKGIDAVDLLKIDTEGNELNVLYGVEEYIRSRKIKAIQFEFNSMNIISKSSFKEFWDFLSNYKMYRILAGGRLLEIKNYDPVWCEIYAYQNIVAILKSNAE